MKRKGILLTIIALVVVGVILWAATRQNQQVASCQDITVPVALAPGKPKNQTIAGTWCQPKSGAQIADILVHGAGYDRTYWDWPVDSKRYSYVRRDVAAGRATFAYDRLGIDKSSQLPSRDVTMDSDAYVLHQLVRYFRNDRHFTAVNIVGHSFGSFIAAQESSQWNDANKLVLTAMLHQLGTAVTSGKLAYVPANTLGFYKAEKYDDGWLAAKLGGRSIFYDTKTAEPAVIAYDDAHPHVVSGAQYTQGLAQFSVAAAKNLTNKITIPVLLVNAEEDNLHCVGAAVDCENTAAIRKMEAPYYAHTKSFTLRMIANTGHDIALHASTDDSFAIINKWLIE